MDKTHEMTTAKPLSLRIQEGAEAYAKADRSDPFAYARAQAHIRNGICGLIPAGFPGVGEDAFYKASFYMGKDGKVETRGMTRP